MGTHPIFESDFDCLTDSVSQGCFPAGRRKTSINNITNKPRSTMGKDPNKPRGRTTAYAFFVIDEKAKYQTENPGKKINFGEFSKLCGKKWQTTNEDDRVEYDEKAALDKERYEREMAT